MKYFLFVAFIILLISSVNSSRPTKITPLQNSPLPTPVSEAKINFGDKTYRVNFQKIEPNRLKLIPNFDQSQTSQKIVEEKDCIYGANGGFYIKDGKPLGLFYADGQFYEEKVHPGLLTNGFLYKTTSGELNLIQTYQQISDLEFIFQSGPLFSPKSKLDIKNDEYARRILLGKTDLGEFYFLAITESDNVNSGPFLTDLPAIIDYFNSQPTTYLAKPDLAPPGNLQQLLNLDGGSASAFYSENGIVLDELVPVGSFLCGI